MEGASRVWITPGARDLEDPVKRAIGLPDLGCSAFDSRREYRQVVDNGHHLLHRVRDPPQVPATLSITMYPGMTIWLTPSDSHYFVKHPMEEKAYESYMSTFFPR